MKPISNPTCRTCKHALLRDGDAYKCGRDLTVVTNDHPCHVRETNNYMADPTNTQVGGNHYSQMAFQPIEFITMNGLGFLEGNVVKYISRHGRKNGAEDIRKAIHYCELILKYKYNQA